MYYVSVVLRVCFFETGAYIVIVVISPYQRNTIQTLLFKLINW